ncbi:MAG: tripartite tricarboxylate transporter substrate binding protein [Chloroflexia bacterium]|nr:tripartite tricarboxylate transporter substrate binding protein [Chloroflexia bacterium]
MGIRRLSLVVAVLALLAAACGAQEEPSSPAGGSEAAATDAGGSEAAGGEDGATASLECQAVDVIIPYSPGGGSDQQVRRLQSALEDATGTRLNITYQEGGDGSVGWNALANAAPDGCTISNVVLPNISNLSLTAGEEVGFNAEDFEYIAFTEYSPNIIGVGKDSEYQTIEDFINAAKENPGKLSIAGVGSNGELLVNEVLTATDMEITYVPVSGGVGDIIPQVAGGHVDAAISGFSLLDGEQLIPIALSGTELHEDFPDVPTFEEAGYPGVNLVTTWGFILPPETPQEIVEAWNAAVQKALQDEKVQEAYAETSFIVLEQDAAEARSYFEEQHEATKTTLGQ